jgi:putative toxin-antitoxin system antitoxin component (TIGR02293 family)
MNPAAFQLVDGLNVNGIALELLTGYGAGHRKEMGTATVLRWIEKRLGGRHRGGHDVSGIELHHAIEAGIPGHAIPILQSALGLTKQEFGVFLGRSRKTLSDLLQRKHLSRTDGDLLYRLARALVYAVSVFEDPDYAVQWLKEPNEALGGARPLNLLVTAEGNEIAHAELAAVEHGLPV